jgi:P4 family phage/plasmid primase-like protien
MKDNTGYQDFCDYPDYPEESMTASEKMLSNVIYRSSMEALARWDREAEANTANAPITEVAEIYNKNTPNTLERQDSKALVDMSKTKALQKRRPIFLKGSALIDPSFFRGVNLVPDEITEVQQGVLASRIFSSFLAYSRPLGGFLVFTGKRWEQSNDKARGLFQSFAIEQKKCATKQLRTHENIVNKREKEVEEALDNGTFNKEKNALAIKAEAVAKAVAKEFYSLGKRLNTSSGLDHAIKEATPHLAASPEDFDADPFLLNTPEGTVDLRTGKIRPHNHADLITKITSVSPSLKGMDKWRGFLTQLTRGDKELELFLQILAGMCLIGRVHTEILVLAKGSGSNGKSTFFNVLKLVMAEYACMLSPSVITESNTKNMGPEMATLKGKRLALAAELASGKRLDANAMKSLVSTDDIHAEAKYCAPIDFKPSHTLILFTNNYPNVRDLDHGTWRRILAIPFSARFEGAGKIENYGEILHEEAGGAALSWMIEGSRRYASQNFSLGPFPKCIEEETKAYRSENSWISKFIESHCECGTGLFAKASELYAAYVDFTNSSGAIAKSQAEFSAAIVALGYGKKRRNYGITYEGLNLR